MPQFDLPLDELRRYRSDAVAPADLHAFWVATFAEAAEHDLDVTFTPERSGLVAVETYDVVFRGFGGHPIRAWLFPLSPTVP